MCSFTGFTAEVGGVDGNRSHALWVSLEELSVVAGVWLRPADGKSDVV